MDHEALVCKKMTERYLLDELDSEVRDEFEEHYFDCPKCAFDVRAGTVFIEQSKVILAETRKEDPPQGKATILHRQIRREGKAVALRTAKLSLLRQIQQPVLLGGLSTIYARPACQFKPAIHVNNRALR